MVNRLHDEIAREKIADAVREAAQRRLARASRQPRTSALYHRVATALRLLDRSGKAHTPAPPRRAVPARASRGVLRNVDVADPVAPAVRR
jgi:hypothetical protein